MTTVFYESFYGRLVGDNPLAIDRELTRMEPGLTRYWSVADPSTSVPDGAIPVAVDTPGWHAARAEATLLVVNDWLRYGFRPRAGQTVLQTWHGTPLKRLALSRRGLDPRRRLAAIRESRRWDILLAQSPWAAAALRRAYLFRGPVWVEGYPRNDILADPTAAARTRAQLGIDPTAQVLLYAPTWRDDRTTMIDDLDTAQLAADTRATVLVRGHTRTPPATDPGGSVAGPSGSVINVTDYPDTAALLAAADALITDYSSVMFDFAITGRPLYFFAPDLRSYARGMLFDLETKAPGPVARTQAELTTALLSGAQAEYAEKYAIWQRIFTAREDGRAAERVVQRILDAGLL